MSRSLSAIFALVKIAAVLGLAGVLFGVGGYVAVLMALSGEEIQVPDVVGMPSEDAESLLVASGLVVELDDIEFSDEDIPRGHVLRQNPPSGTSIKRQRGITLTLSSGLAHVYVPDTAGDIFTRAQIALQQQDVEIDYIARVNSREYAEDRVIAQQPDISEVEPGSTISARLLVSLGPPPTVYVMPELIGHPVDQVRPFLESHGFRLAPVRERSDQGVPPGTVINQQPSPGFQVTVGDVITLVVSQ
jgi:beta-lactam-binding protein with PASTA domain